MGSSRRQFDSFIACKIIITNISNYIFNDCNNFADIEYTLYQILWLLWYFRRYILNDFLDLLRIRSETSRYGALTCIRFVLKKISFFLNIIPLKTMEINFTDCCDIYILSHETSCLVKQNIAFWCDRRENFILFPTKIIHLLNTYRLIILFFSFSTQTFHFIIFMKNVAHWNVKYNW